MSQMRIRRRLATVAIVAALATPPAVSFLAPAPAYADEAAVEAAFEAFWAADSPAVAGRIAVRIVSAGATFEDVWARLKAGRRYGPQPAGIQVVRRLVAGVEVDHLVEIPEDYDPAKRWRVRVQLHGGVGRDLPGPDDPPMRPQASRIPGSSQIHIEPRAWDGASWWHASQVANIAGLLDWAKRRYNVDESRVYLTGISDGGSGAYYLAMRAATPWSACLPINGHPLVLANREARIEGLLFLGNLANCPLYIINGDQDPLYPSASVAPLVEAMHRAGASPVFRALPNARHDTRWWPTERAAYERFIDEHPRDPHPARVTWETDSARRDNRFRWLVIDGLGARPSDAPLEAVNSYTPRPNVTWAIFPRGRQPSSGRVDVTRNGNVFDAVTRGVTNFTLLLSPDVIDFAKPVRVNVNGAVAFEGRVDRSVTTLLRWAALDNDRTLLYGAELKVTVP